MEIFWYGHSCFRLSERSMASVVTDPYDSQVVGYDPLKLKADIVTISHDSPGHNHLDAVKGTEHRITSPGEFEIGGRVHHRHPDQQQRQEGFHRAAQHAVRFRL